MCEASLSSDQSVSVSQRRTDTSWQDVSSSPPHPHRQSICRHGDQRQTTRPWAQVAAGTGHQGTLWLDEETRRKWCRQQTKEEDKKCSWTTNMSDTELNRVFSQRSLVRSDESEVLLMWRLQQQEFCLLFQNNPRIDEWKDLEQRARCTTLCPRPRWRRDKKSLCRETDDLLTSRLLHRLHSNSSRFKQTSGGNCVLPK